ncbi:MAG: hypothetical protein HQL79_10670 [Magnetococcales bacterium]|nr:hypothetical protein [Magnetococcales bacterium]
MIIRLDVTPSSSADFKIHVSLNGQSLGQHSLPSVRWRELSLIIDHFRFLFVRVTPPEIKQATITSTGIELFDVFLAPYWSAISSQQNADDPLLLVIHSPIPEILHLPWEALLTPLALPWVLNHNRSIRRTSKHFFCASSPLFRHPVKVLIHTTKASVAMPPFTNSHTLTFHINPTGRMSDLIHGIKTFKPHLLILHGTMMVRMKRGFLLFVDEEGEADPKTGEEIFETVLKDSDIHCVIVSGREPNHPPPWSASALLADAINQAGIPVTLSWPDSIQDNLFHKLFLDALAQGSTIDDALGLGRTVVNQQDCSINEPLWSLPWVFGPAEGTNILKHEITSVL